MKHEFGRASCLCWGTGEFNPPPWIFETLSRWADEELKSLVKILPKGIQDAAGKVAISFEEKPGQGDYDEELEGDELGLFEGPSNSK